MKVKFLFLLLFTWILFTEGYSRDEKYAVADIPEELLEGSKIVIRNHETIFQLNSEKGATANITYAITILHENGEEHAVFINWYNKYRKIRGISGKIYDQEGKVADRVKLDKVVDYSAIQGFSLFEDTRIKGYKPEYRIFPYTIEYTFTVEYKGILNCPSWSPYLDFNTAVEKSKFQIRFPVENPLRYYEQNIPVGGIRHIDGADSVITWEVRNLPPIIQEPFSPTFSRCTPVIYTAPTNFEYGGYEGNAVTWENFGDWIYDLMEGKDFLPEETVNTIHSIIEGKDDEREKIRILYEYMQNKTRYANIAIGIGGYQPIDAESVDRLGYGDCKALSNYMAAILKVAGIPSAYTLVNAGNNPPGLVSSFPSNQFNHAILCVPLREDTVWLECTSQRLPSGFIGDFTDDREVLVVSEEGSRISRTTCYNEEENLEVRTVDVHLDENGNGIARMLLSYFGIQYGNMVPFYHENKEGQEDYLLKQLSIPNFKLSSFTYEEKKYPDPTITGTVELAIRNYSSSMGNRIILPVNFMNDMTTIPKSIKERRAEIEFRRDETIIDSIVYHLPDGYIIDNISPPVIIDSEFGNYSGQISYTNNKIYFKRRLLIKKGTFPPGRYDDLVNYYKNIRKADQAKVILRKI